MNKSLETAIDLAGGQTALARKLSSPGKRLRQSHVWSWLHRDGKVPPEFCLPIEKITGGRVQACDLRPDIYPYELYAKMFAVTKTTSRRRRQTKSTLTED